MGLQKTIAALANEENRKILELLQSGPLAAGAIARKLQMSPAAVSYHLAKLKQAGLLYETRRGNFIDYEADLTLLDELVAWVSGLKGEESDET